jgi:hypothetical protein
MGTGPKIRRNGRALSILTGRAGGLDRIYLFSYFIFHFGIVIPAIVGFEVDHVTGFGYHEATIV